MTGAKAWRCILTTDPQLSKSLSSGKGRQLLLSGSKPDMPMGPFAHKNGVPVSISKILFCWRSPHYIPTSPRHFNVRLR